METKEQERNWHLVRNDNGEWISDKNVVFLTKQEARSLQIKARISGKTLSIQHGYDGDLWCYKHEMDYINQKLIVMNNISLLEPGLLDAGHSLYQLLKGDQAPSWWKLLTKHHELYVEIRKKNVIDVYYYGGRMAEISYDRFSDGVVAKAHPKYLGYTDVKDENYYRRSVGKGGKEQFTPIYQDCLNWLESRVEELKENIRNIYSQAENGENTKEKFIQGKLITEGRDKYLDSEFAHRFHDHEKETIRIDMVKIEDNRIIFEELKRIGDSRLRTKNGEPEILTQIRNYREFLQCNKDRLAAYYKMLYRIKKELDLPVPSVDDVDSLTVDPEPQLLIACNYKKDTEGRKKRIDDIERILSSANINYRIDNFV
ncbi:hypothetical protein ACTQ53_06230 [Prevotella sp. Sow4_E9_plate]|uniref:hypothetical protein n=1 Tax=Prevotella sp. Sow4_E9_plate TaxID=3438802 RepID=UPI003F95703A